MTKAVPEYPERVLIDISGRCNLKCPMCLVHGSDDDEAKAQAIGEMTVDNVQRIIGELPARETLIQPNMWGEPLLTPHFEDHIQRMKDQGLGVAINTNGLTLKEDTARFMVDCKVDSLFFSVDAMTPETLKKVRGIDKLDKIERNARMMMNVRGDELLPRIGASFTVQDDNAHEVDEFVDYWIGIVDVVRVGYVFEDGKITRMKTPEERIPCGALYHTMPIHFNGDALVCCLDGFAEHVVGNVFDDGGVKAVWHGEKFTEIRHYHETGQWDKVPLCKDCNAWAGYIYEEELAERNGVSVLVRRSPQFDYYNRVDRLDNWQESLKGHEQPDLDRLEALDHFAAE